MEWKVKVTKDALSHQRVKVILEWLTFKKIASALISPEGLGAGAGLETTT
jgi:hypothetical protein